MDAKFDSNVFHESIFCQKFVGVIYLREKTLPFRWRLCVIAMGIIASTGHCCAAQPLVEPGALVPGSPSIYFLVPEGQRPSEKNIRTLFVQSVQRPGVQGVAAWHNVLYDFDTGNPAPFDYLNLERAPVKVRFPFQMSSPVVGADKARFDEYYCNERCFYEQPTHGSIDGQAVRIERVQLQSMLWGKPFSSDGLSVPYFDIRYRGYWAFRAVTITGQEKWAKVYLLQTEGTYMSPKEVEEEGISNVVETVGSQGVAYLLSGDRYFYIESDGHNLYPHIATKRYFGDLTMRVDIKTGMPVTKNPHIKAVGLREFQLVYDAALNAVEQHYPKVDVPDSGHKFFPQAEDGVVNFDWTGDEFTDVSAYINFQFQQHWFKGLIK